MPPLSERHRYALLHVVDALCEPTTEVIGAVNDGIRSPTPPTLYSRKRESLVLRWGKWELLIMRTI
jgi:hypothetical protein